MRFIWGLRCDGCQWREQVETQIPEMPDPLRCPFDGRLLIFSSVSIDIPYEEEDSP